MGVYEFALLTLGDFSGVLEKSLSNHRHAKAPHRDCDFAILASKLRNGRT